MSKKTSVLIGIVVGVLVIGVVVLAVVFDWFGESKPVNNDIKANQLEEGKNNDAIKEEDKESFGVVPNIINRAGTIKEVGRKKIIINGPDDEDIVINVKKDTMIYGADGMEKEIGDLEKGMYITIDIDGDLIEEDARENEFDAMIIYVSGK